jgi:hypothetical protein
MVKKVKNPVAKKPKKPKVTKKSNNQKQSVNVKINIDNNRTRTPSNVIRTAGLTKKQLAQQTGDGSSSQRITSFPSFENVSAPSASPSLPLLKDTDSLDVKKEIENQIEQARQRFIKDNTMRLPRINTPKVPVPPRVIIQRGRRILTVEEEEQKRLERNKKARDKRASDKISKQEAQQQQGEEYEMQNNPMNFKTPERGNESFGNDILQEPYLNPQQSQFNRL